MNRTKVILCAASFLAVSFLATGCSTSFNPKLSGVDASGRSTSPLSGRAMGGQQPISGARIYLYASGQGGYGTAATSLLYPPSGAPDPAASTLIPDGGGVYHVLTTASGGFNITGSYVCPTNGAPVYLLSVGGDAGAGANSAAVLMLALGSCLNLTQQSYISINELTTVAAVTALQQFIGPDEFSVSTSSTNSIGIGNAMIEAGNLVNINYGYIMQSTPAITNPVAKLYTLADALAACVNSVGPSSSGCTKLFAAAYVPTGTAAVADTFRAMEQIALYPSYNPQSVLDAIPPQSAFGNALSTAPNDFSLAVAYHGGGLGTAGNHGNAAATAVAIDLNGNAWVAACGLSCGVTQADSIVEIAPYGGTYGGTYDGGYIVSGPSGFGIGTVHNTQALVIDSSTTVYSTNDAVAGVNSGFRSTPSLTVLGATGTVDNDIHNSAFIQPEGTLIDPTSGSVVIADFGSGGNGAQVYSVNTSGGGTVSTNYIHAPTSASSLAGPTGLAIDAGDGAVIVADTAGTSTVIYGNGANNTYTQTVSTSGATAPTAIVLTSGSNFWELSPTTPAIYKLNESGALLASSVVTNATSAQFIAVDGAAEVFVPGCGTTCGGSSPDSLVIISDSGTPVANRSGLQDDSLAQPVAIAVDPSGNAWIGNGATGAVTEFIGVAAPVLTPIVSALSVPATRP